jgi:hypothetical protein
MLIPGPRKALGKCRPLGSTASSTAIPFLPDTTAAISWFYFEFYCEKGEKVLREVLLRFSALFETS